MGTSCSICVALKWRCKAIGTSCSLCVAIRSCKAMDLVL